jgi:hypothetical protein
VTDPPKKAFALRVDPALYEALQRCAAGELRSANAQIELMLREGLARRGIGLSAPEPRKRGRPPRDRED